MLLQPHYSVLPGRVSGGRESKGVEKRERGRKKKKEKKWIDIRNEKGKGCKGREGRMGDDYLGFLAEFEDSELEM